MNDALSILYTFHKYKILIMNTLKKLKRIYKPKSKDTFYADSIVNLRRWHFTSYMRTHFYLKPHIADKYAKRILSNKLVESVYYTLENDSDGLLYGTSDTYLKKINKRINHMHFLIGVNDLNYVTNMSIPVKKKEERNGVVKYVNKQLCGLDAFRETLVNSIKINSSAVGDIQPILNKRRLIRYVNKNMNNPESHYNFYFN